MKLKSLTIAIALAATSASSFAAEKEGFYIGAFGDYYDSSWENIRGNAGVDVDDSTGWGAEIGYRFNDYWSARLEYADMDFDVSSATGVAGSVDADRYGIDALYHIGGGPFYGVLGLKELDVYEGLTFANLGAGYQHFFTDNFAFNAEASIYQGLERGYTDGNAKLGISYLFGDQSSPAPVVAAAAAPVVMAPSDSDDDGVNNEDDKCANTPMSDAVDATGCTLYEQKEVTTSLLVTFPHDSAVVNQKYFDDIAQVAKFLKEHPKTTVSIEGHASAVGEAAYNKTLSKKRADDVADELIKDGISADRISTIGYGEERLKNDAYTLEAHAENRRVEAHLKSMERTKVKR